MPKRVRIRVIRKPEPDLARLAMALLALIRAKQEQEHQDQKAAGDG